MMNLTFDEINTAKFSLFEGNPVIERRGLSPIVADPSVVTPKERHDGKWHMICHNIFGLVQYVSEDGYTWNYVGKIVRKIVSRAMRGKINRINGEYYI